MWRRNLHALLMLAPLGILACAPAAAPRTAAVSREPLPAARETGVMSVEEALRSRRSVREFAVTALTARETAQLLWAAQGVTDREGHRTAPSAGALYPLETFVVSAEGVSRYIPAAGELISVRRGDVRRGLHDAALGQEAVLDAPLVIAVFAVYERTSLKYGLERGERYAHLEAGHAAQNVLLQATALGLGAVPIGAFDDEAVREVVGAPDDHAPLYLIAVGHARGG